MEIENIIQPIVENFGVKLYDIELVKENDRSIFRIYVKSDKENIDLNKCAEISNILSPILDTNPPTKDSYFLEVSSPGLERKLKKTSHFENSIGELVKITTSDKDKLKGKLLEVNDNGIKIETKDGEKQINFDDIKKAKTYIEW